MSDQELDPTIAALLEENEKSLPRNNYSSIEVSEVDNYSFTSPKNEEKKTEKKGTHDVDLSITKFNAIEKFFEF